jgi:general secretion pathway protein D
VDPQKRPGPTERITINFDNADLRTVIKFISELTGKNFIVDDKVKGNVTILSPTDITVEEAYRVFLSVLEMKGFTVVEAEKVTKIVPSAEARYRDIDTIRAEDYRRPGKEDRLITQIVPLSFANANDLRGMLTPMVSKESQIVAYNPTNTLIITDYATNIQRILGIIRDLDVESSDEKITFVTLKYASAQNLVTVIQNLMEKGAQRAAVRRTTTAAPAAPPARGAAPGQPASAEVGEGAALGVSKLVSDDRTNSLIIVASAIETQKIMGLIEKLDVPLPAGRTRVNVYYLENAKAEEVLQVLSQLGGRGGGTSGGLSGGFTTPTGTRSGLGGGTEGGFGRTGTGSGIGLGTSGMGRTGTTGLGGGAAAGLFGGGVETGARAAFLGEDIQIVADKPTNSLVVISSPQDYEIIKDLVGKLDIMRSQVLVEGLIAEVSLDKTKAIGVEWNALKPLPLDTTVLGGTGPAAAGVASGAGAGQPNLDLFSTVGQLAMGVFTGPITIAGERFLNLQAVARAFQTAADVNILSTPHILTLNNEEAEIVVAQNIPFLKSQTGTAESTAPGGVVTSPTTAVLQTFEFKDVGIVLRITPQISRGKFVRLNLFQEVSDVGAGGTTFAPTTFKRQAKTTVVVENGQTLVIGGLVQDSIRQSTTGVPCLASIPVLGNLFRQQSLGPNQKRNLLIFITPHIVTSPSEMADITDQKRKQQEVDKDKLQQWRSEDAQETLDMLLR